MIKSKKIAVIPARGGSKRIKRKNIIEFHGKPLLCWTIEAALTSELFDVVVVSTDDKEIASIAQSHGASVPFLRDNHLDDLSPISLVTAEVLQKLSSMGNEYEMVVQLMANCPLRTAEDIKNAVNHFENKNPPSQISCFRYGWMNPWWAVKLNSLGDPTPLFPDALKTRSQDLPALFCPTGAIWIAKPNILKESQNFYCRGHIFCELSWRSAIDIDDEEDLQMARTVFTLI